MPNKNIEVKVKDFREIFKIIIIFKEKKNTDNFERHTFLKKK